MKECSTVCGKEKLFKPHKCWSPVSKNYSPKPFLYLCIAVLRRSLLTKQWQTMLCLSRYRRITELQTELVNKDGIYYKTLNKNNVQHQFSEVCLFFFFKLPANINFLSFMTHLLVFLWLFSGWSRSPEYFKLLFLYDLNLVMWNRTENNIKQWFMIKPQNYPFITITKVLYKGYIYYIECCCGM